MTDLITRIEATPADASAEELRKLSDDGLLLLGWTVTPFTDAAFTQSRDWREPNGNLWGIEFEGIDGSIELPNPAASMDDCLNLVPEGWEWGRNDFGVMYIAKNYKTVFDGIGASTPALALWAAILKAASHDQ